MAIAQFEGRRARWRSPWALAVAVALFVAALATLSPERPARAFGAPFREGDILYAGFDGVAHIDPQFGQVDWLSDAPSAQGVEFDDAGNLVVLSDDTLYRYSNQGIFLGEWFAIEPTWAVTFDSADNAFFPDDDGSVLEYDSSGTPVDDFAVALGSGSSVTQLVMADDDCTLFYTTGDTVVRRYDVCLDSQLGTIGTGLSNASHVALTNDGDLLVSDDDVIRLYDSGSGTLIETFGTPSSGVFWRALTVANNDEFYAVNEDDNLVHVFEIATGDELTDLGEYGFGEGTDAGPDLVVWQAPSEVPATSISRYVQDLDTNAGEENSIPFKWGCELRRTHRYGAVILTFGQAWDDVDPLTLDPVYGTLLHDVGASWAPITDIELAVERFLLGYSNYDSPGGTTPDCVSPGEEAPPYLYLLVGTNSFWLEGESDPDYTPPGLPVNHTTYDHGAAWADMVSRINDWLYNEAQIGDIAEVVGGLDAEVWWNTATATNAWADGYDSQATVRYYDFGSADGCPSSGTTSSDGLCDPDPYDLDGTFDWLQSERWSVAWDQGAYHWPFPEVYHNSGLHSPPWQQLSLYGVLNSQAAGQFLGVLVQHQACLDEGCDPLLDNDAEQGFTELWEELNGDPATASYVGWTSDISWQWMSPPAIN